MKKIFTLVFTLSIWLGACSADPGMRVYEIWMRPAMQGENSAVYFIIQNYSREPDELIGISSDIAQSIEIHETMMNGDVMEMHHLETIPLEGYAQVEFAPGGRHIMLIGLKQNLRSGDEVEITLHFKNYPDLKVIVPVKDAPE